MNINKINEGQLGYSVTIVTMSGNKIQGTILKSSEDEDTDMLKLKTKDGIIMVNCNSIESIY
ncbi:hypothetical protein [Clostridium autoethanogenum]|uniref:Uncharacterized protein n=1 Tax=Clostridium autoethanogenum DSM 10061 TaxID=1341692 RepID=A0ABN4BLM5_9CLOT|nr:hypothetical protein [Clostridium autoethanogenum]AGY78191.1 hypothetical protein CAETHG_3990 [Clostridium autoethanogenum DSM 10061]ALU38323.1 Hypothetical protein CLAU_3896 [Clostridium autoethanogenum DSM 10061]OVY51086.1 hypothetical protein WX72_02248 [Clostridium autoethanogenum]